MMLKQGERLDDLHRDGYMLIQNPEMFCFGLDAVLLSDFAKAKADEVVLDMCCGNGIVPILMEAKTPCSQFVGIEIQQYNVDMAMRSVVYNKLQDKIYIEQGDLKELNKLYNVHMFDVVTCNPPYIQTSGGALNESDAKSIARHEIACTLEDVMKSASDMLKYGGRFYMVHRVNRIVDIFELSRKYKLEPKLMRFVHAMHESAPSMMLIEFIKNGKPHLEIMAPLILYAAKGINSKEFNDILYNKNRD